MFVGVCSLVNMCWGRLSRKWLEIENSVTMEHLYKNSIWWIEWSRDRWRHDPLRAGSAARAWRRFRSLTAFLVPPAIICVTINGGRHRPRVYTLSERFSAIVVIFVVGYNFAKFISIVKYYTRRHNTSSTLTSLWSIEQFILEAARKHQNKIIE